MMPKRGDRDRRYIAGHRGPTDHRRKRAGGSADHDVPRCPALEPDRIDEDVEGDRQKKQAGSNPVDRDTHDHDGGDRQCRPEFQSARRSDAARGYRTVAGAAHHGVDIPLIPHVDAPRGTCAQRDAQHRDAGKNRMQASVSDDEADRASEHHQRHHPRLEQREEVARRCGQRIRQMRRADIRGQDHPSHSSSVTRPGRCAHVGRILERVERRRR